MGKRICIGLMVASMVAVWGTDANAFNRINGILIKHGSLEAVVFLNGPPAADTLLTVAATLTVEMLCKNPQDKSVDPGTPERQEAEITQSQIVTSDAFDKVSGKAEVTFVFDFDSLKCHQKNFKVHPGSVLAISVSAVTAWTKCNGKEPGPDGVRDGNACYEFDGAVQTINTKPIEAVQTTCTAGVREPDGTVSPQELPCVTFVL